MALHIGGRRRPGAAGGREPAAAGRPDVKKRYNSGGSATAAVVAKFFCNGAVGGRRARNPASHVCLFNLIPIPRLAGSAALIAKSELKFDLHGDALHLPHPTHRRSPWHRRHPLPWRHRRTIGRSGTIVGNGGSSAGAVAADVYVAPNVVLAGQFTVCVVLPSGMDLCSEVTLTISPSDSVLMFRSVVSFTPLGPLLQVLTELTLPSFS
ncbi:hypothetical protein KSP40_PGU015698 [Platanthera guangdongensis]|uniref:Uncharacterized protein n=1 Tax=Platanthera guangdongensis TaxID=2320717 RepID=A0ABR2MAG0_9ASPA